jgi:hypothetical protein
MRAGRAADNLSPCLRRSIPARNSARHRACTIKVLHLNPKEAWTMRGTASAAATLAFLLLPALARSQEPVKSFDQLNTRLRNGDRIVVTDTKGREHKGHVVDLSASTLTLDAGETRRLTVDDVQLVQDRSHDSLKNGALIGLASGLAIGGIAAADCARGYCEFAPGVVFAVAGGIYGGLGAAIGTGIDALIPGKKRIVYQAPDGKPSTRLMLSPVVTPHARGIALSMAF